MISAFIDRAITSARMQKKGKMSDDMLNSIRRALEAAHLNIEQSEQEKRALVEYARLINSIHKSFVSELYKDNKQASIEDV